jgi:hypothetical protein
LWLNTTDKQLFVYTGTTVAHQTFAGWELAGPEFTSGQTLSGFKIETVTATSSANHVVAFMYSGNIRVACVSQNAEFTPQSAITGFATIYPGITLNSTLGAVFSGTTTSTTHVNVSESNSNTSGTVIAGKNFLRSDVPDTTTGSITVDADSGVIIGDGQDLELKVSGINATIANVTEDGDLSLKINDGNVIKTPIAITGSTGNIDLTGNVTITGNLTITGSYDKSSVDVSTYVDAFIGVNENNNTNVDGGLIVEQNGGVEARLFWDQSEGYWSAGKSNTTYSQIIRFNDLTADGDANKNTKALKTDGSGNLTVTDITIGTAFAAVSTASTSQKAATIRQVAESISRWGGSVAAAATVDGVAGIVDDGSNSIAGKRYVDVRNPRDVGDGDNGDLWFVRES